MNSIATNSYGTKAKHPYGMALGIIVSLALHALFIYGYRFTTPVFKPDESKRVESIAVWIRPAPPQPIIVPKHKIEPAPARVIKERRVPQRSTLPAPPASTAITLPAPASQPPSRPDTPNDPFAETTPKFDIDAARATARKVASERDPAKANTAVGQIPDKPLETETPLARSMSQAKRGDCKNAPGGLLAPLLMLMDKKDSGCKW